MTIPSLETIVIYTTIFVAVLGALLAAIWLSLVIWTFRDMRLRSRDPFAQLFAALVVAILPIAGIAIYLILRPPETLAHVYERALEEEALLQEIEERPQCPGCSRSIEPGWMICPHCHTHLRQRCPDCSSLLELQWNLCPFCGSERVGQLEFAVEATAEDALDAPWPTDGLDEPWPADTEQDALAAGS